jgi:hypothetical protein
VESDLRLANCGVPRGEARRYRAVAAALEVVAESDVWLAESSGLGAPMEVTTPLAAVLWPEVTSVPEEEAGHWPWQWRSSTVDWEALQWEAVGRLEVHSMW